MACIVSGNEIILTGAVGGGGWFWDEDSFSHADVITALSQVGRDADITIRVNSGGGIATEGAAIHAALAQHKGRVDMVVEGWAASAASLFIMAGDRVTMRSGSLLMIHDPSSGMWGTSADHRRSADALDVMANTYAQVYADRTGQSAEAMRAVMRAETWLGPAEAVAHGFADAAEETNDNTEIEPVAFSGIGAYQRAPASIVALAQARGWGSPRPGQPGMSAAAPVTALKEHAMSEQTDKSTAPADSAPAPADPAAITEACAAAGMPATLAASLIRQGATMAKVGSCLADAKSIIDAATLAGMVGMGAKLVAAGVSLDTARDLIAEARAAQDEAGAIDTAHANANPGARPAHTGGASLTATAYANLNKPRKRGKE